MPVVIKQTLHKMTIDSKHLRLVQLTNDVYKLKSNDRRYEWEESNKSRAVDRFIEECKRCVYTTVTHKNI